MKKQTYFVRIMLLLLASVFVLTAFAGCKDEKLPEETEPKEEESGNPYDEDGYLKDTLPANLDFNADSVTVLYWEDCNVTEFDVKDMAGDEIEDAIFERDAAVEERIDVDIEYTPTKGNVSNINNYKQVVQNAQLDGKPFDILAAHTRSIAICASDGLLTDLGSLEGSYLDFDAPWWNDSIVESTRIGESFFFTTGDVVPSFVQMIYCTYFNADAVEDKGLTSPYEHVANNTWTMETLMGMTVNYYQDFNNSMTVDEEDIVPLIGSYYAWPALLHGCDIGMVDRDEATGSFILDPDLGGEKGLKVMEWLANIKTLDGGLINESDAATRNPFIAGKNLFAIMESSTAANYFAKVEFEYGCVPMPKYDSEQTNYVNTARQTVSLVAMSQGIKASRIGMVTATLEAMASESYRSVTPVIFDRIMQYQKAASEEMRQMLILIRDTGWFDMGRIYSADLSYICDQPGRVLQKYPTQTWENYVNQTVNTTIKTQLEELSKNLLELVS